MADPAPLPLDEILSRAQRLVERSPSDLTSVSWLECARGTALESARSRRTERVPGRAVAVRVRLSGRTGAARGEAAEPAALEALLRLAMVSARAAEPSPDWAPAAGEAETLPDLHDPALEALEPGAAGALLQRLAEKRATLRLRWTDLRLAVASSFQSPQALRATEATLEARTGRRPGSGFAAATRRRLADLDLDGLVVAARALEAPQVAADLPAPGAPILLAPEAAVALVEAYARRALATRRFDPEPVAAAAALRWSPAAVLRDEPLAVGGAPLPFDLDGVPKRAVDFARGGAPPTAAFDLELAARAGSVSTGHGLACDEAWPIHLALGVGGDSEEALRADAAGGIRIGGLEELRVELGAPYRFRAVARSLRRIEADGRLGDALAPLVFTGDLEGCFAAIAATADHAIAWAPLPIDGLGACRAPAARLSGHGRFAPRTGV